MDMGFIISILPDLGHGALITLLITAVSFVLAAVLGLLIFAARKSKRWLFSKAAALWIDFFRSTPLLVHIYALFFVLPEFNILLSPLLTGILALALHNSCYLAEIYRSSWEAIARGQSEAAHALGLSRLATTRLVILPQMMPRLVPDMGNFLIYSFKDSPLVGAIAVAEIMYVANGISAETFRYFAPISMVGVFFLTGSLALAALLGSLERRVGRGWKREAQE